MSTCSLRDIIPSRPPSLNHDIRAPPSQGSLFPFGNKSSPASAAKSAAPSSGGTTNEVVSVVNGMRQRRMGGGDIMVSEMGLGKEVTTRAFVAISALNPKP